MAFEPKTWACGDTITAQELNRIEQGIVEVGQGGGDAGYECTETEVTAFDGSLTTNSMGPFSGTTFTSSQPIDGDSILVTFDGIDYELPKVTIDSDIYYGEVSSDGPVFTTYPCVIGIDSNNNNNYLFVASNGTYQVSIKLAEESVVATECFKSAVKSASTLLLKAVSKDEIYIDPTTYTRVTYDHTWQEVRDALKSGTFVCVLEEVDSSEVSLYRVTSAVSDMSITNGYPFLVYTDSQNPRQYAAQSSDGYVCELINGQV